MKEIKTMEEFNAELESRGERLVLFHSDHCPFCRTFLPAFRQTPGGRPGTFILACVDALPELEDRFDLAVVPTVLFFKDGTLKKRLDGVLGIGLSAEKLRIFAEDCGLLAA